MYSDPIRAQPRQAVQLCKVANGAASITDLSPVQSYLARQRELLRDLEDAADCLIDPLRTALDRDPREQPKPIGTGEPEPTPACDLEASLIQANGLLESTIRRLREIRNAIRL